MIDFILESLKAESPITMLSNLVYEDRSKHSMELFAKASFPIVKFLMFLGRMIDLILEPLKAESPITMLADSAH